MQAIAGTVGLAPGFLEKQRMETSHPMLAAMAGEVVLCQEGQPPERLDWQGESYVLAFYGRLDNAQALRCQLEKQGHVFHSHRQEEVVIHAYAAYGPGCTEQMEGPFSLALWECRQRRLFLARDPLGVRPLFYAQHQQGLLFAARLDTIFRYPTFQPQLDAQGAAELILLGPGRLPGSGIVRGVYEVKPGCRGYYCQGTLHLESYWHLTDGPHCHSMEETACHVRQLVTQSIERQMDTQKPLGAFLSGGLDSSIVTAVCAGKLAQQGKGLDTFSLDYENNHRYFRANSFQPEEDGAYIQLMASNCQTHHHTTVLGPEVLVQSLEDAMTARGLPGMGDVDASLLAFCREVGQKAQVVLSGECADEIFGGYPWYRDREIRSREGFPWAQNTRDRASLLHKAVPVDAEAFVMGAYRQCCRESDLLPDQPQEEKRMKEMVNLNLRYFMQTLLDRSETMGAMAGVEIRVPFCTPEIAQYLYRVPWEMKDWQGREKGLLRKAMEGLLPEPVLYRKKSPYPKTYDPRYETLVKTQLEPLLAQPGASIWNLLDREGVLGYLSGESRWPWYGQLMRKPQFMAYLLQIGYWLDRYHINFTFS